MNTVIIFSDQQHKYAIGKRDKNFITPNLDELCNDGVLFKNAYSSNPVCGPFRGCLMSGQYSSRSGIVDNGNPVPDTIETLAEAVKKAGVKTGYVGKYHLGDIGNTPVEEKYRKGFDFFSGYQCHNGFNPEPPYNNEVLFWDERGNKTQYNIHRTDATTKEALNMVDRLKGDNNFLLMVSYQAPHYPEQPSKEFEEMYENTDFDFRPDYIDIDPYTPTYSPYSPRPFEKCPDYRNYGNNMAKYKRLYAALCTQVDRGVGEIINKLKNEDLYNNTLIIYMSDHGDMQGSKGLKNKCLPYEMSAGIPFIVKYPKGRKGEESEELISNLDIFPTILRLYNTTNRTHLDGSDVTDYLTKKTNTTKPYVISEFPIGDNAWRMIRKGEYKLITDLKYNPKELYNLNLDRYEMNNLVSEKEEQENIDSLVAILKNKTCKRDIKTTFESQDT